MFITPLARAVAVILATTSHHPAASKPPEPLAKDGTWPTTGNIGSQYSYPIKWTGGSGQIQVTVRRGSLPTSPIVNNTTYPAGTQQALVSGLDKQATGVYRIDVTDAAGSALTGSMSFSYAFYVGYRKQGDGTTVPATAAPFGQSAEGVQTLSLTAGAAAYGINFSKYTNGGTVVVSGGTTGCTLTSNNADVATVNKTNDFTATITPLKTGTVAIRVTTANGDATGLLTVTVA